LSRYPTAQLFDLLDNERLISIMLFTSTLEKY
jgi:hypothetical protein